MSKTGIPCYRNGGCGPYEMYSCYECPASKSDYLQRDVKDYPPYLDYPKPRKPMTNYDNLISQTPEEMADFLAHRIYCQTCFLSKLCKVETDAKTCEDVFVAWLSSPADKEVR